MECPFTVNALNYIQNIGIGILKYLKLCMLTSFCNEKLHENHRKRIIQYWRYQDDNICHRNGEPAHHVFELPWR